MRDSRLLGIGPVHVATAAMAATITATNFATIHVIAAATFDVLTFKFGLEGITSDDAATLTPSAGTVLHFVKSYKLASGQIIAYHETQFQTINPRIS